MVSAVGRGQFSAVCVYVCVGGPGASDGQTENVAFFLFFFLLFF